MELLPQIGLIAVLWFGGNQVINGDLTLGALVQFNVYVALLVWPLRMIGMTIAFAQRAAAALGRVNEVLDTSPQVRDPEHPVELPAAVGPEPTAGFGAIAFRGVEFTYPTMVSETETSGPVLDGFDLDMVAGESVAIVGATGSGKSTVVRLLVRFYDVDAGSISIDGVDIRELSLHELRRAVGIVFEDTLLFHDTVRANIAFADPTAGAERVERAARLGRRPRLHHGSPRRLRHDARRTRLLAVGRPATTHRDRSCDPGRPADPGARRRDVGGRPVEGARDPRSPWRR